MEWFQNDTGVMEFIEGRWQVKKNSKQQKQFETQTCPVQLRAHHALGLGTH